MMLTLIVTAAAAAAAGYLVARRRGEPEGAGGPGEGEGSSGRAAAAAGVPAAKKSAAVFEGMPLALGDVVLAEAEERWLAGAVVAREGGRVVAALFTAPEGAKVRAVAVYGAPRREIFWLAETEVMVPAEPPATLEIGASMLSRRGRLPVIMERLGQGAPRVGESGLWATYEGGGREVAVVITSEGRVFAWSGKRLDEGEYERLGAGGTDDES
jgi:hypothetical protein